MSYLLDSDVFIHAKNRHYGLDFCPAFWDWLLEKNVEGTVFSIDKVADEIAAGRDELSDWMKQFGTGLICQTDTQVAGFLSQVSAWTIGQQYDPAAISTFLQGADYYLIAHALAKGQVVVTHEVPANSQKKIKIPDVCNGLGLLSMTPFEMLRREKARFVLGG